MPRILRISLPIALALLVTWAEPSSACHGKKGRGGGGCGQPGYAGMSPATYYGSGMTVYSAAPGNPYAYGYAPGMAGYADGYGYGGGYGPGYGGGYGYGPGYGMNRGGFGGPFSGLGVRPGFGFGGLGRGR